MQLLVDAAWMLGSRPSMTEGEVGTRFLLCGVSPTLAARAEHDGARGGHSLVLVRSLPTLAR
ncbi:UNVERIFIED_ORG: hypothetical protein GGD48_005899 [Rhizobium etli]